MQKSALFLNGVYDNVLREIMASQVAHPGEIFFLQPYKSHRMTVFADSPPNSEESVPVYISTTDDLNHVRYVAEIVNWEDKRRIPPDRLTMLNRLSLSSLFVGEVANPWVDPLLVLGLLD